MALTVAASYGSMAKYKNFSRLHQAGNFAVVGASGDMSDFQHIEHLLESET